MLTSYGSAVESAKKAAMATALLTLSIITLPAMAQTAPAVNTVTESQAGKVTKTSTVKASAEITAIDKSSRKLTLKKPDGHEIEVVAGSEVRNFEQIKVNDTVNVEYVNSLTLDLKKPGETAVASSTDMITRSEPGKKPGGVAASTVTIVADVIDVNPATNTITLQGPNGKIVELDVKNPDQFKVVKKGDKVEVTYAEAVAIMVEPAPRKPAK